MKWTLDATGAQWTATVAPNGQIRVLRRVEAEPYRAGGEPREEFTTFLFSAEEAGLLADTLNAAADLT